MPEKAQATCYRWDEMEQEDLNELLSRRFVSGEKGMVAQLHLKKGCVVPRHSHENEQFTYILHGALRFSLGDNGEEEVTVRGGEILHIPSNLPHEAVALQDTLDLDIFSPPRQDWIDRSDDYLRRK